MGLICGRLGPQKTNSFLLFGVTGLVLMCVLRMASAEALLGPNRHGLNGKRAVFSQSKQPITISIVGVGLKACGELRWTLVQKSSRLLAVIPVNGVLACKPAPSLSFNLPSVRHATGFILSIEHCPESGNHNDCRLILQSEYRVYPSELFAKLRQWSEKNQVVLNDKSGELAGFFDRHAIAWVPHTVGASENDRVLEISYLTGEMASKRLANTTATDSRPYQLHIIEPSVGNTERLFSSPVISREYGPTSSHVTAELHLVSRLNTDLLAQLQLLQLIDWTLSPSANNPAFTIPTKELHP